MQASITPDLSQQMKICIQDQKVFSEILLNNVSVFASNLQTQITKLV